MKVNKIKVALSIIASFAMFAITLLAMAENKNDNNIFLDYDQDGLTDQEEKMLGTDPRNPDTDGDGYTDGKEVQSGYNPLKSAPGDRLISWTETDDKKSAATREDKLNEDAEKINSAENLLGGELTNDIFYDFSSDPENPNLTNEMIGELMALTADKAKKSEDFADNPDFSLDDFDQVAEKSLEKADIIQDFPEIRDEEIKILPPVNNEDLEPDKVKEKQKQEIQKYLASLAFIFASNSPFAVDSSSELESNLTAESNTLLNALNTGDKETIDSYAQKAQTAINQMKNVEVPFVLKDAHKSILALSIYTVGLKDKVFTDTNDPVKSLLALSSLQAVAEASLKTQEKIESVLNEYGISFIDFDGETDKEATSDSKDANDKDGEEENINSE